MPSSSKKQHNFMAAIAHNPAFAKKVGVPQSVGKDFNKADKGKTFKKGGDTMATKNNPFMEMIAKKKEAAKGGMTKKMAEGGKADMAQDKAVVKKALRMHDAQEHKGGKGTDLSKLKKGGMPMKKMAGGGLAAGHKSADGVATKGKTRAMMPKMSKGGKAC
jgi:hypothetical protein